MELKVQGRRKRGALRRKKGDGNDSTMEKEERSATRKWLKRARYDIILQHLTTTSKVTLR